MQKIGDCTSTVSAVLLRSTYTTRGTRPMFMDIEHCSGTRASCFIREHGPCSRVVCTGAHERRRMHGCVEKRIGVQCLFPTWAADTGSVYRAPLYVAHYSVGVRQTNQNIPEIFCSTGSGRDVILGYTIFRCCIEHYLYWCL